ncbi:MAG: hypothetical protein RI907_3498 [Pseudomonadota bacterium]|jgi:FHA domain-containing protein
MHLLIRAVSLAGQPLTQAISAYFDERGGTMGRSDTNTLALPDPERRISRLQAEVARVPEGWRLTNVGNANPIWHNNKAVAPGEAVLLGEGDELQVGTYSLHVSHAANDPAARTITQGRPVADARTVIVGSGSELRTDPSRMAFQVNMVASPASAAHPSTSAHTAAHTAAHLADDGATRLVSAPSRSDVTQLVPPTTTAMPTLASVATVAPAPAQVVPAPAAPAQPAASPFDDLLGAAPPAPAFAAAAGASASPFDDLLAPSPAGLAGLAAPAPAPVVPPAAASPFLSAAPSPAAASADPFADLLGPAVGSAPAGAGLSTWGQSAPAGAPATPSRLPDDFDPFADLMSAPGSAPAPVSASPFDGLQLGGAPAAGGLQGLDFMGGQGGGAQGGSTSSIDQLFGLGGGASADPLAAFMARSEPTGVQAPAVGAPSSVDPLALLTPAATAAPEAPAADALPLAATPLPDDTPEVQGLMPLPPVLGRLGGATEVGGLNLSLSTEPTEHAEAAPARPAAAPANFDELLEGLAASVPAGEAPVTMPGPLSVQSVELPALAAQSQAERTVLVHTPSLLVAKPQQADVPAQTDPVLSLAGELSLAEPIAFDSLQPHARVEVDAVRTAPGDLAPWQTAHAGDAPHAPHADTLALWSAFCQGAGVNFTPPQGLNPDFMRVIGQLLRHSVDGTLKLVAARAATKQELRAEVTVIQAKGNNPLKFSPDAQSALEQLLQPPLRGFMAGPAAVSDVMDDLLGHVIGTMVGTRAALEGVLQRFEPGQLEAKLSGRSVMDSLLPMNRRAKLWELYLQHYDSVRTEAQEDFHNLFGRAFLQAYEEQLDRLDAERRAASAKPGAQGHA